MSDVRDRWSIGRSTGQFWSHWGGSITADDYPHDQKVPVTCDDSSPSNTQRQFESDPQLQYGAIRTFAGRSSVLRVLVASKGRRAARWLVLW